MASIMKRSIKHLVIGFGFLNGIWFSIGVNPEDEILKFLSRFEVYLPPVLQWLFIILPLILMALTFVTLIKTYRKGGILGSIAVLIAFMSGTLLLMDWITSIILLIIAIIAGIIGFRIRKR